MSIIGIDHILLAMPAGGESKARDFYVGVLGLAEKPKPPALARRGGAWFTNGSIEVHLGVEADFRPAQKAHPAFLVRRIADFIERARASNCRIMTDEPLAGYERVFVHDPFCNRIELMERVATEHP